MVIGKVPPECFGGSGMSQDKQAVILEIGLDNSIACGPNKLKKWVGMRITAGNEHEVPVGEGLEC